MIKLYFPLGQEHADTIKEQKTEQKCKDEDEPRYMKKETKDFPVFFVL